jgi:hypothetical protein
MCPDRIGSPDSGNENAISSTYYLIDTIDFLSKPIFKDKAFLHQKYVVEKLSMKQIAELCSSSRPTVSKHLKIHGIAARSHHERIKLNKGQLAVGERRWRGAIQQNKAEGRIVSLILDLRGKGYSYRQIAAWLDAKGIGTKNGRGAWQAVTVMKIYKRFSLSEGYDPLIGSIKNQG